MNSLIALNNILKSYFDEIKKLVIWNKFDVLTHLWYPVRYINLQEFRNIIKRAKHLNTTSDSLALISRLVNEGDGITILPSWFKETHTNLVCLDELDFNYETEIQCICRNQIAETPKVRAFVNFFTNLCSCHNMHIEFCC